MRFGTQKTVTACRQIRTPHCLKRHRVERATNYVPATRGFAVDPDNFYFKTGQGENSRQVSSVSTQPFREKSFLKGTGKKNPGTSRNFRVLRKLDF